jgi:hypothetical protein
MQARVDSYHFDASRLAAVGLVLGLDRAMEPYFIIDCPNCGQRVQVAGGRKPLEPGT